MGRLLAFLLVLVPCTAAAGLSWADERPAAMKPMTVVWHLMEKRDLCREQAKLMPGANCQSGRDSAFARWDSPDGVCHIYTIVPRNYDDVRYDAAALWHELRHCAEGNWHD